MCILCGRRRRMPTSWTYIKTKRRCVTCPLITKISFGSIHQCVGVLFKSYMGYFRVLIRSKVNSQQARKGRKKLWVVLAASWFVTLAILGVMGSIFSLKGVMWTSCVRKPTTYVASVINLIRVKVERWGELIMILKDQVFIDFFSQ